MTKYLHLSYSPAHATIITTYEFERKKICSRAASQCGNSNLHRHMHALWNNHNIYFCGLWISCRLYRSFIPSHSIHLVVSMIVSIEIRLKTEKPQRSDLSLLIHSLMNGKTWKTGRLKSHKIGETRLRLNEMIRGQNLYLNEEKNCKYSNKRCNFKQAFNCCETHLRMQSHWSKWDRRVVKCLF